MRRSAKIENKKSVDPVDRLIFEKGLRIKNVVIDKSLDILILILNNGAVVKDNLSNYSSLKNASQIQLQKWKLIGGGVGVSWANLKEDLSVKGFIMSSTISQTMQQITNQHQGILN